MVQASSMQTALSRHKRWMLLGAGDCSWSHTAALAAPPEPPCPCDVRCAPDVLLTCYLEVGQEEAP